MLGPTVEFAHSTVDCRVAQTWLKRVSYSMRLWN